jgi:hypothetical protein
MKCRSQNSSRTIFSVLAAIFGFALSYTLISQYTFTAANDKALNVEVGNIGMQLSKHN